jgi:DNA-binding HxlR family transcriptional regulator
MGRDPQTDKAAIRRRSGQVTRQLRLLRAHGLIRKVPRTHRYMLNEKGKRLATLLLAAKNASIERLAAAA